MFKSPISSTLLLIGTRLIILLMPCFALSAQNKSNPANTSHAFPIAPTTTIRFQDATLLAGVAAPQNPQGYGHGASFADYDGDGDPDIFMLSYNTANFLFRNNGDGTFTNIAARAGVEGTDEHDRGTATADYDNDGDEDIYVACGFTGSLFFRNNGDATFAEVSTSAGVDDRGQGQGVAWGDYNRDGLLDLFVCNSVNPNRLFRQNTDHNFIEANGNSGIDFFSNSAQPVFFDLENDGDLDIFVTRGAGYANLLYVNQGGGFSERAAERGVADPEADGGGVSIADYDRDGDLDIYTTNNNGPNRLYNNSGGYFQEVAARTGLTEGDGNCIFADFDDDGWLDLYLVYFGPNMMYRNNGNGTFSDVSVASGTNDDRSGHGASVADYDSDGDLDIFFTNSGQNSALLQNLRPAPGSGSATNWLQIRLRGDRSNRDGVGARLAAWTAGKRQTQFIFAGAGYVSGAYDLTAHFGLGPYRHVDSLIIYWPSGTRDRLYAIAANQRFVVPEGRRATYVPADTTRPKIFDVIVSNVTATGATISWQTDKRADSQVEFGFTPAYSSFSRLDTSLVTSHTLILADLAPNTIYHFRVRSQDALGNLALSSDFSFATPMPAVVLYTPFELKLSTSNRHYNTYFDVNVTGVFTSPTGKELRLAGFWDGGQIWRVRFSPNEVGLWKYRTESDDAELVTSGAFAAKPSNRHGFVRVSKARPYQFEYSDGTPFLLMGETNWTAMSAGVGFEQRFKPYIDLRVSQHFNAFHSIVVPGGLEYGFNEGGEPFGRLSPEVRDYDRLLPGFFQWVDRRVAYADSMGMVSILFFTWASEVRNMSVAQYRRLALYIVSRYAAYNVFWILAGDYQAYFYNPPLYRQVGEAVAAADPFDHPISIHPADDYVNREFANEGWLSYVMHQLRDAGEFLADSIRYDRIYNKPVVNGEYGYHVPESVHPHHGIRNDANYTRTGAWSILAAGGYFVAGFGRTFFDPDGHYGYDPGYDHPPLHWDLNFAPDLEAARQYGVLFSFVQERTNWTELEPHQELVLDGQTQLFAKPGVEYMAYNARGGRMRLQLPIAQPFSLSWFNPVSGVLESPAFFESTIETILITPSDTLDAVALLHPATAVTLTPAGNVTDLRSEQLNIRQVRFRWTTPEPADSRIEVQKPNGTRMRFIDTKTATQHELVVDGILPEVRYRVTVSSQTGAGRIWKTAAECLLTTEVVLDQFIEAETMPTKTVGRAEPPGWNLDANGFLAMPMNFPQAGAHRFEILSRGEYRNKTWPQLALSIDNGKPDTLTINSAVFRLFRYERRVTAGPHTITLAFTNPGDDRQLIIDQLHVQLIDTAVTPPPVIAGIAVSNLTTSAATITWKTATPTAAQIEYGAGTNYGLLTPLDFCRDTTHVFTLSDLTHNTTYHFRVRARDAAGKLAVSRDTTFTTLTDRQPPLISNIAVSKRSATSATITWSTDEPSTSQVEFGLTASYGHVSALNPVLVNQHEMTLLNLVSFTTFHARLKSTDAAGNTALSADFTFMTLAAVERLVRVSGDGQSGKPLKLLASPLVVKVLSAAGAAIPSVRVAFRVVNGGGQIVSADTCNRSECVVGTDANGLAAVKWQLGAADSQRVEVRVIDRPDLVLRFVAKLDSTGVEEDGDGALPSTFVLRHYPNPFREVAQFEIALPAPGRISLKIFDVQGREVVTLFDGAKTAGRFLLNWNGRDQRRREIAAGIYFAVLRYETKAPIGGAQILTEKRQVVHLK